MIQHRGDLTRIVKDIRAAETASEAVDIAALFLHPAHQERTEPTTLEVIVNGQPVVVTAGTVRAVIEHAIRSSRQIGAPVAQWELRTTEGDIIPHDMSDGTDYELTPGRRLWLNLGPPIPAPARAAEWYPIETSPKNGAVVLGWSADWACGMPETMVWLYRRSGLDRSGWYTYAGHHRFVKQPTHWQPLPLPPCALTGTPQPIEDQEKHDD